MPFSKPWLKGNEKALASYCLASLPPDWQLTPTDYLGSRAGHRKLAGAIYDELASRQIQYAPAFYNWQEKSQRIRTPEEILGPPKQGTCLDLSLLFAGLCLAHQLCPLIVVLDGHAFAAVCLTETVGAPPLIGRAGEPVFSEGGGVVYGGAKQKLQQLLSEAYLPVECTGFARWERPPRDLPEGRGRTDGLLPFDAAVDVGREQLSGSRQFLFALDVYWVQHDVGVGVAETEQRELDKSINEIRSLLTSDNRQKANEKSLNLGPPHEILSPVEDFTNRKTDLTELLQSVRKSRTILIFGQAGLGKTELARRLAAEIGKDYPDGQVYIDLKGASQTPVQPREILSYLIEKFSPSARGGTDVAGGPIDVEELAKRYVHAMHGKRALIFLDNVADSKQVSLVGPPSGCLLLMTAHGMLDLPDLPGVTEKGARELPLFSQTDSELFLLEIVPRVDEHARALAIVCGGLPFALRRAAGFLLSRPDQDIGDYVQKLLASREARNNLAESVISTGYDLLSPPELKQQWCSLSCFVDPFSREAIEAIWCLSSSDAERIIDLFIRSSLLHYDRARRGYYLHDLDRIFAQLHLEEDQPYSRRHAAYFLRQLFARRHPLELLDPIANEVFAAYDFCELERKRRGIASAIPVVEEILEVDEITAAWRVYLVARLLKRKHRFSKAQPLYDACCQVAVSAACVSLEGACLRSIGEIHWILGNQADANRYCERAIKRLSSRQDYESQKELIFTLHLNSERYLEDGLLRESEKTAQDSLDARDRIRPDQRESPAGLCNGVIKLIAFQLERGELETAKRLLDAERGNLEGISLASTLGQVGCAMRDAGRYLEAEALFQEALRAYAGNDVGIGWIHRCMVELELRRGDFPAAGDHVQQALSICSARGTQGYEAYQISLTSIAAMRFYYHAGDREAIARLAPRLTEMCKQIEQAEPAAKRKVVFALAGLEETLSSCGRAEEAELARAQRARLETSIQKEEAPSSGVELLADRWGCDALALAWPGQLLRLLSPRRRASTKA
jgi:tetratricopeptide (TPR) repeat protein